MSSALFLYDEDTSIKELIINSDLNSSHFNKYNNESFNIIFDCTTLNKEEKIKLFSKLNTKRIVSDLTCYDPYDFFQLEERLVAAFSSLFITSKKTIEVYYKEEIEIESYFKGLGISLLTIQELGPGFIYARTFAQIVNEAYFALEEEVASKEDIDRAMKYGVNYPFGPFEWSAGKEKFVVRLLTELKEKYKGKRYEVAPLLLNSI